jgi:hypothetical protein
MPGESSPRGWEQGLQLSAELTILGVSMTDIGILAVKMVLADVVDMRPPTDPSPGLIALRGVAYREWECARRGCFVRCLQTGKMRTALRDTMITSPPRGSRLLRG